MVSEQTRLMTLPSGDLAVEHLLASPTSGYTKPLSLRRHAKQVSVRELQVNVCFLQVSMLVYRDDIDANIQHTRSVELKYSKKKLSQVGSANARAAQAAAWTSDKGEIPWGMACCATCSRSGVLSARV